MNASLKIDVQMEQRKIVMIEILRRLTDFDRLQSLEDIRTAAHSPKGDKAHPRHCVEDERPSNAVRHIPIGWGDERGVTRH